MLILALDAFRSGKLGWVAEVDDVNARQEWIRLLSDFILIDGIFSMVV